MIDEAFVRGALEPPEGWTDSPEQAQLRECLAGILSGHDPVATSNVCLDIITLMRDQLMSNVAYVRRQAAREARATMSPKQLVEASGKTPQTISRLLTESRGM
jgi:hypothetical protein